MSVYLRVYMAEVPLLSIQEGDLGDLGDLFQPTERRAPVPQYRERGCRTVRQLS